MTSPFEELEYLADHLPDEGEAVVLVRREGELVCEPFQREGARESGFDPEFYGRLVQANERLRAQALVPVWTCGMAFFWACVAIHTMAGLDWQWWFLDAGLALMTAAGCFLWIRRRRAALYRTDVRPMIHWQLRRRRVDQFALIGVIRQQSELKTLLTEMATAVE